MRLTFIVVLLLLTLTKGVWAMPDVKTRAAYQAITAQDVWLNAERKLTVDDLEGRIILLDFWTFCCINCIHVMPDLHYLEERFGDKLAVIGVHSAKFANEKDTENIRQAILRYNIKHPVVNDHDFGIWQRFGVRAWPTFVLMAPDGRIAQIYSGEGNRDRVERDVEALIAEYGERLRSDPLPIALEKDKAPKTILSFPGKLAAADDLLFISDNGNHRMLR